MRSWGSCPWPSTTGPTSAARTRSATRSRSREVLTHRHLAENNESRRRPDGPAGPAQLPGPRRPPTRSDIDEYAYEQGDMYAPGSGRYPPRVPDGLSLTFLNQDAEQSQNVFHTITACKAPCNRSPGIAYPIANGPKKLRLGPARLQLRGLRRHRPSAATRGTPPGTSARALTPTSAGSIPSCVVASGWSRTRQSSSSQRSRGSLVTQTSKLEPGRRLWAMPIIAMAALAAATLVAIALVAPATSQAAERVRVMTRNVYLGADLTPGTNASHRPGAGQRRRRDPQRSRRRTGSRSEPGGSPRRSATRTRI